VYLSISERFLFVSSLFYFRIPRSEWRDRLSKVRVAGYDAIDVYVPWNFHERAPGEFCFDGVADVGAFIDLAQEMGLQVIARPGPYICSEWDGGGMPAWLFAKPEIPLRQNDEAYLAYVQRWYDQVLPILRDRQAPLGPIVAVQVENELDFYPTVDPKGYIETLAAMARRGGMTVPVTACIGQWKIAEATGHTDMALPMINVYPSRADAPELDEMLDGYVQYAHGRNEAAMIMETGRDHLTLSRLIGAGFVVISPYLMVSGVNMDQWHGVNNWGTYPSFIATDYDFGGMIAADGTLREAFYEQRALTGMVRAHERVLMAQHMGPRVDGSSKGVLPRGSDPLEAQGLLETSMRLVFPKTSALRLRTMASAAGRVHFLYNLTKEPIEETFCVADRFSTILVPPGDFHVVVEGMVGSSGWEGFRWSSTSHVVHHSVSDRELLFVVTGHAEMGLFLIESPVAWAALHDDSARVRGQVVEVLVSHGLNCVDVGVGDGRRIRIVGVAPSDSGRVWALPERGLLVGPRWVSGKEDTTLLPQAAVRVDADDHPVHFLDAEGTWLKVDLGQATERRLPPLELARRYVSKPVMALNVRAEHLPAPLPMEQVGLYHGRVGYHARFSGCPRDLRLHAAGDLVFVYLDGRFQGAMAPAGGETSCTLQTDASGEHELFLMAESWGHSNFHDEACISTRLGSLRGVYGTVRVLTEAGEMEITDWTMGGVEISGRQQVGSFTEPTSRLSGPEEEIIWSGGEVVTTLLRCDQPETDRMSDIHCIVSARNARVDVYLDDILMGRMWFGPHLSPNLVGGRKDAIWLRPDAWQAGANTIRLESWATDQGGLDDVHLEFGDQQTRYAGAEVRLPAPLAKAVEV